MRTQKKDKDKVFDRAKTLEKIRYAARQIAWRTAGNLSTEIDDKISRLYDGRIAIHADARNYVMQIIETLRLQRADLIATNIKAVELATDIEVLITLGELMSDKEQKSSEKKATK